MHVLINNMIHKFGVLEDFLYPVLMQHSIYYDSHLVAFLILQNSGMQIFFESHVRPFIGINLLIYLLITILVNLTLWLVVMVAKFLV